MDPFTKLHELKLFKIDKKFTPLLTGGGKIEKFRFILGALNIYFYCDETALPPDRFCRAATRWRLPI